MKNSLVIKLIKFKFLSLVFLFVFCIINIFNFDNIVYASNVIGNSSNEYFGPVVLNDCELVVTGDSFAGKFCEYENNKDLKIVPYAIAGKTIIQNKNIMLDALNFNQQNVLFSIGVNDMFVETMPYDFEATLRQLLSVALIKKKNVIMHSYLMFFSENYFEKRFNAIVYDQIIQKLCIEYPNAYYINVHDLENRTFISDDLMHYNERFYNELYIRVFNQLRLLVGNI